MSDKDDLPELTPEEIKNGWTPEAVARLRKQQDTHTHMELMDRIFPTRPRVRVEGLKDFDPFTWNPGGKG